MTTFRASIHVLTPLHIGDGHELLQGFDFVTDEGHTYRLNEDEIIRRKQAWLQPNRSGQYPPIGDLLDENDFNDPALFHYILRGIPRSVRVNARVQSCIKDVFMTAYLPGSSLKGAIRTALAWNAWVEIEPRLDRSTIGRNRSWAAQPLEKKIFGPDPNHDLLRALQVSDFLSVSDSGEGLMMINALVMTPGSVGAPVELEAIAPDCVLEGTIRIDESLFSDMAEGELHFNSRKNWLTHMLPRIQTHSQARIEKLAEWFEQAQGGERVAAFYRQLEKAKLNPNQALLQVGWGAGWDSKTFWTYLQNDPNLFEQLIGEFRMTIARSTRRRRPGMSFPGSRRIAAAIKEGRARAVAPLGWVLLELSEI